jgi:hypothetical protein
MYEMESSDVNKDKAIAFLSWLPGWFDTVLTLVTEERRQSLSIFGAALVPEITIKVSSHNCVFLRSLSLLVNLQAYNVQLCVSFCVTLDPLRSFENVSDRFYPHLRVDSNQSFRQTLLVRPKGR